MLLLPSIQLVTRNKDAAELHTHLNDHPLQQVSSVRMLGVLVNFTPMSFAPHVNSLCQKLKHALHIMNSAKPFVNRNVLRMVFNAYFMCHLNYCAVTWGPHLNEPVKTRLIRLLLHAARLVLGKQPNWNMLKFSSELQWLPIEQHVDYHILTSGHQAVSDHLPSYINELFTRLNSNTCTRATSAGNLKILPLVHVSIFQKSFQYYGTQ